MRLALNNGIIREEYMLLLCNLVCCLCFGLNKLFLMDVIHNYTITACYGSIVSNLANCFMSDTDFQFQKISNSS